MKHSWIDYLPVFGVTAFTVIFLASAYRYNPQAREFPAIVAWVMLGLLALDLISRQETALGRAIRKRLNPGGTPPEGSYSHGKQAAAIAWLAALCALTVLIGILYAVLLYVFVSARFRGGRSYGMSGLTAAGVALTIWLLFTVALHIDLYRGIIFGGG